MECVENRDSIRDGFGVGGRKSKAYHRVTEDHGGNPGVIKVDLFDRIPLSCDRTILLEVVLQRQALPDVPCPHADYDRIAAIRANPVSTTRQLHQSHNSSSIGTERAFYWV